MKKVIFIAVTLVCLSTYSHAQSSAALQLKKYCIVDPSAQFIINHSHGKELNVSIDDKGWRFQTVQSTQPARVSNLVVITLQEYKTATDVLQDFNKFLDPGWVACLGDDFWSLISKQLDGKVGSLSTTNVNYTICASPGKNDTMQFYMAFITWIPQQRAWMISAMPGISGMREGSRFIRLR